MSALISTIDHALAVAAGDVVKMSKFVEQVVVPAMKKAQAEAQVVEAVTALVSPQAVNVERVAFALLGVVIKARGDAQAAAVANGMNVNLDAQLVADLNSVMPTIQSAVKVPK